MLSHSKGSVMNHTVTTKYLQIFAFHSLEGNTEFCTKCTYELQKKGKNCSIMGKVQKTCTLLLSPCGKLPSKLESYVLEVI